MIIIFDTDTIKRLDIDYLDFLILKIIYASENKQPCFLSHEKFAEYLGVSRQTINTRFRKLEEKGYLITCFKFKRVSKLVKHLFLNEKQKAKAIRKVHAIKKAEEPQKEHPMITLFNEVYNRIKRR